MTASGRIDAVAQWATENLAAYRQQLVAEGVLDQDELAQLDAQALARVDEAVAFAESSPFPKPESLYDDVYVLGDQVQGWYSVDERSAGVHRGEDERELAQRED